MLNSSPYTTFDNISKEEYKSNNAHRLSTNELIELLMGLDFLNETLKMRRMMLL